ncbi:MAG: transcriptional repressor [Ruminococcaceae bacterium]|nr:transcriptional repressor [Oscillospiraceae bacterium]
MTTVTRKTRHSETRDRIYEYMCSTKAHPSAETIYAALKPGIPKLSLATVYVNLKLLKEQGKIIRVANVDGNERYDANCEDHVHFVCDTCGSVIDLMDSDIQAIKNFCNIGKLKINSVQVVLHGVCEGCTVK